MPVGVPIATSSSCYAEPEVPYEVYVSASTQIGFGPALSTVFFTREGGEYICICVVLYCKGYFVLCNQVDLPWKFQFHGIVQLLYASDHICELYHSTVVWHCMYVVV